MKMQELLTIDPQFKNLIPPLQRTEYLQLEPMVAATHSLSGVGHLSMDTTVMRSVHVTAFRFQ